MVVAPSLDKAIIIHGAIFMNHLVVNISADVSLNCSTDGLHIPCRRV